jgi:hypothetical protein
MKPTNLQNTKITKHLVGGLVVDVVIFVVLAKSGWLKRTKIGLSFTLGDRPPPACELNYPVIGLFLSWWWPLACGHHLDYTGTRTRNIKITSLALYH